jgi:hypothetical protein
MAVSNKSTGLFLVRLAGLTGLMGVIVGLVLWLAIGVLGAGLAVLLAGACLLAMAVIVELQGLLKAVLSQRGAVGFNVCAQIALALILLVEVNWFSFFHFQRFDWTSEKIFTIKKEIRDQLSQLRGETDIVVSLRFNSCGDQKPGPHKRLANQRLVDKAAGVIKAEDKANAAHAENGPGPAEESTDSGHSFKLARYQAAARRKIVEKVKDLAEEFQHLGPRFRVEVLNIEDEDIDAKMRALEQRAPELWDAVVSAPENSVFFHSQGQVQRLSFNDIYELDSVASFEANKGRGNLVLNYQGVEPFARKILNLQEKRPRIGVAVVHEILSLDDPQDPRLTMNGVKNVLDSYSFDTRDIILKKWSEMGPEPTVYTFDESRFEGLEEQRLELEANIKERDLELRDLASRKKIWAGAGSTGSFPSTRRIAPLWSAISKATSRSTS